MKRKIISLVLAACMLTSLLSGCAESSATDTTEAEETISTETEVPETTVPETEPETTAATEAATEPATEPMAADPVLPEYSFALTDNSITLTEKGQTLELYCGDIPLNEISWLSADESIALFSQGKVVAVNEGVTVVYAKYREEIIFCEVVCDVDPDAPAPYIDRNLLAAPRLAPPYVEDMEDTTFFDDAVFIGDSVSYVLQQWSLQNGAFGGAVFLARSSLGLQNSIDGRLQLSYRGVSYSPEDAVAAVGAKKLFVMLGMNDIALYGVDGVMERWGIFLGRILEKSPDIEIYIQSCTPIHRDREYSKLNNDVMDEYNAALEKYCQEKGYHFVNVSQYFKDYYNSLASVYSSDMYVHFTYEGAAVWEQALKAYAAEQMQLEMEEEET